MRKWRRVWPSSLSSMLEISPISNFFLKLVELGVGLLERRPALDRVGQEARARGLQRPAELLGDLHGGAAQDLGVELVGAALDLLLDLVEQRDQLVAVDREAVALGLLRERVVDPGLPVDQGAVDVEGDEGDFLGSAMRPCIMTGLSARVPRARMDLLEYQGKQLFARHGIPVPAGAPAAHRRGGGRRRRRDRLPVRRQGAGADRRPRQGRRHQGRPGPRRGRGARQGDPRHGHPRLHGPRGVDRGAPRTSPPSTTRRSSSTARPRSRS